MAPKLLVGFFKFLDDLIHRPVRVLVLCVAIIFVSLILEGSLFQLWSLYREHSRIQQQTVVTEEASQKLVMKIERAKDPQFIELQARDRFDLVQEGDLVFVFSDAE